MSDNDINSRCELEELLSVVVTWISSQGISNESGSRRDILLFKINFL